MSLSLNLEEDELFTLTGYRQHARQRRWLAETLRIQAPARADGLPVVSRAQVEAALAGKAPKASSSPRWSTAT